MSFCLEDFLEKIIGIGSEGVPIVYVYEGEYSLLEQAIFLGKDDGLLTVYKSCYKPKEIFSDNILKKKIKWITRTNYGLAILVE